MAFTKQQRKFMSGIFNQGEAVRDQLRLPLTDESRFHYDGESTYEYGFIDFEPDMSDEDIDLWFDENMRRRIPSSMYWDCTGCLFTRSIDWHRNPNGLVSFVHWMEIDV